MTLRAPGASSVTSVSLAADGSTLAATASNGARVFDLRAPASDRPARLASKEVGQRWCSAHHVGEDIFTVSTQGDVFAWSRSGEGLGRAVAFSVKRAHHGDAFASAASRPDVPEPRAATAHSRAREDARGFRPPVFACAPASLGAGRGRLVLRGSGEWGERVRAWDAESGETVGEWGADGESIFGAAPAGGALGLGLRGVARAPVTAACWGSGDEGEPFGRTSFAVGTADGIVRVYGP
jgi:hypothetical protein